MIINFNRYKFRLIMTCPAPIFDSLNQTQTQTRDNVTSYADLTVLTNQAPVGKSLEVIKLNVWHTITKRRIIGDS